jgi:hypothetical protein
MNPADRPSVETIKSLLKETVRVYLTLIKIMVPTIIVVKILDSLGGVELLAWLLSPLMTLVGLPDILVIVWATAMVSNLYAAMTVFYELSGTHVFTVAEISVLSVMLLLSHGLPVEGGIAKAVGVRWSITLTLRIGGALLLGALTMSVYQWGDWQQQPIALIWQPELRSPLLVDWALEQLKLLTVIFFVILGLIGLLKLLRYWGIERFMHWFLTPFLKALTMSRNACNVTVIGITLGLSFGGGLLIHEVQQGGIDKRDTLLSICFLGLCHSLIEDTLLMLLLGADIHAILWGRLAFAILVITLVARMINRNSAVDPR